MKTPEQKAEEYLKSIYKECFDDPCYTPDVSQSKKDFLAGYKAANEWISVEDELPEQISYSVDDPNGNSLYFYKHYNVKGYFKNAGETEAVWIGVYMPYSVGWNFKVIKPKNTIDFIVTHWKPIE